MGLLGFIGNLFTGFGNLVSKYGEKTGNQALENFGGGISNVGASIGNYGQDEDTTSSSSTSAQNTATLTDTRTNETNNNSGSSAPKLISIEDFEGSSAPVGNYDEAVGVSQDARQNQQAQEVTLRLAEEGIPEGMPPEQYLKQFAWYGWNPEDDAAALAIAYAVWKRRDKRNSSDKNTASNSGNPELPPPTNEQEFANFMIAEPGETVLIGDGILITIPENPHFRANRKFYYYLLSQPWVTDGSAQDMLSGGETVEPLANTNDVSLDYYGITLILPGSIAPSHLFNAVARQPDVYSTGAWFQRRDGSDKPTEPGDIFDIRNAISGIDPLMAVMDIVEALADDTFEAHGSILVVDRGVIGDGQGEYIVIQTITSTGNSDSGGYNYGNHPVDGTRGFGYTDNGNGTVTIWTMGADSQSAGLPLFAGRAQQEALWVNWLDGLGRKVVYSFGGEEVSTESWRNYTEGQTYSLLIPANDASGMSLTDDFQSGYDLPYLPLSTEAPIGSD
jgi:hypothetical protein